GASTANQPAALEPTASDAASKAAFASSPRSRPAADVPTIAAKAPPGSPSVGASKTVASSGSPASPAAPTTTSAEPDHAAAPTATASVAGASDSATTITEYAGR